MAVEADGVRSPVEKFLTPEEIAAVRTATGAAEGDLILIVADRPDRVAVALDGLRRRMAERLELIPEGRWSWLWVTEPPLFEWSEEEQRWVAQHHPFTSPLTDDLSPETAKARAYDIVLNGVELASGSIRIHRPEIQRAVFEAVGLSPARDRREVRAHDHGVRVRRPPARRYRARHRPARDDAAGPGLAARRDGLPEGRSPASIR